MTCSTKIHRTLDRSMHFWSCSSLGYPCFANAAIKKWRYNWTMQCSAGKLRAFMCILLWRVTSRGHIVADHLHPLLSKLPRSQFNHAFMTVTERWHSSHHVRTKWSNGKILVSMQKYSFSVKVLNQKKSKELNHQTVKYQNSNYRQERNCRLFSF